MRLLVRNDLLVCVHRDQLRSVWRNLKYGTDAFTAQADLPRHGSAVRPGYTPLTCSTGPRTPSPAAQTRVSSGFLPTLRKRKSFRPCSACGRRRWGQERGFGERLGDTAWTKNPSSCVWRNSLRGREPGTVVRGRGNQRALEPQSVEQWMQVTGSRRGGGITVNRLPISEVSAEDLEGSRQGAQTKWPTHFAVDALLHAVLQHQHVEGLVENPHHHGLGVQRAALLRESTAVGPRRPAEAGAGP